MKETKANIGSEFPAMPDYPRSLVDFQRRFPDQAARANHLAAFALAARLSLPGPRP